MSDGGGLDLLQATRAIFRSALRAPEKLVALALLDHWSRSRETFPSVQRLAVWTSLDRTSVMRALAGLEQKGAINVTRRHGAANRYELGQLSLLPVAESDQSETGPQSEPVVQDDQSRRATSRGERLQPVAESDSTSRGERHEVTQEVTQRSNPLDARAPTSSPTKGAPRRKRRAPAPEIPLPADWQPTEAHRDYAAKHGLNLDLEADSMRGWAEGRTAVSWNGTFTTRLANQAKWNRERSVRGGGRNGPPVVQRGAIYREQEPAPWDGPKEGT